MNDVGLRDSAIQDPVEEVAVLIQNHAKTVYKVNGNGREHYGIKYIQDGVNETRLQKAEKQRLIDQFTGLATPVADEMRALRETVAAQGEQIEALQSLVVAFLDATLQSNPRLAEQLAQEDAAAKSRKKKSVANALG